MHFVKVTPAAVTNKPTILVANTKEVLIPLLIRIFICFCLMVLSVFQEASCFLHL